MQLPYLLELFDGSEILHHASGTPNNLRCQRLGSAWHIFSRARHNARVALTGRSRHPHSHSKWPNPRHPPQVPRSHLLKRAHTFTLAPNHNCKTPHQLSSMQWVGELANSQNPRKRYKIGNQSLQSCNHQQKITPKYNGSALRERYKKCAHCEKLQREVTCCEQWKWQWQRWRRSAAMAWKGSRMGNTWPSLHVGTLQCCFWH